MEIKITEETSVNVYRYDSRDFAFEISENEWRSADGPLGVSEIVFMLVRRCISNGDTFVGFVNPKGGIVDPNNGPKYIDIDTNFTKWAAKITKEILKMKPEEPYSSTSEE